MPRVPVPGVPRWVGHAELERHHPPGGPPKLRPRVRLYPGPWWAWRAGRRTGTVALTFWRSLYERTDPAGDPAGGHTFQRGKVPRAIEGEHRHGL